jgi:hypothetical protein
VARAVYSVNFADLPSISGPTLVGTVPDDHTWIVRLFIVTFGDYAFYVRGGLGLSEEGPWSWLCASTEASLIGVSKRSYYWEGRYVVNPGSELWVTPDDPDTMDVYISGYDLNNAGGT